MVGKLTAVLIRKEAEAYRAQGLHEEAFALYDELLASSPNIDEALKSDIQSKMDLIAEEMEALANEEDDPSISSKEVMQLLNGWQGDASVSDILVSAEGLCQMGAYNEALLEFEKLLKKGIAPEKVADAAAESFVNLYDAKRLPTKAEKWLKNIFEESKKILAVHLLFIQALSRRSDKTHALFYCRFISSKSSLPYTLIEKLKKAEIKFAASVKRARRKKKINPVEAPAPINSAADNPIENSPEEESRNLGKLQNGSTVMMDSENLSTENDSEALRALFADRMGALSDEDYDYDSPLRDKKEKKSEMHFIKIIVMGWYHRIVRLISSKVKK